MCAAVRSSRATKQFAAAPSTAAADVRVQLDALQWWRGDKLHQHLRRPAHADAAPTALATVAFDAAVASSHASAAWRVLTSDAVAASAFAAFTTISACRPAATRSELHAPVQHADTTG